MTYKVPLIPPNLRKHESIIQIADSLDHLSKVMEDIMFRIENRINTYSSKLNDITSRVDEVDQKISKLRGVKNAVQIFSSCKYPATDINKQYYESVIPLKSEIELVRHPVNQDQQIKIDEPLEKLHVYHVKLSETKLDKIDGLGEIPNDLTGVNDLLLYNSGKNLYKEFTMSDTLKMNVPIVKMEENKLDIAMAPASIGDRTSFTNLSNQTYFYSPDLGEVPSLDIPEDLPDLPGIAGNLRYTDDDHFVIAPSIGRSPSPSVNVTAAEKELEGLPEIIIPEPNPPPSIEKDIIIEPIKSEVDSAILRQENSEVKSETDHEKSTNVEAAIPIVQEKKEPAQALPNIPDARASLMEAIRNAAGGKKLKSVEKEEKIPDKGAPTGDLMADLHAKLAMRRKGMSGTQKNNENSTLDTRGALSLMSSLIPAPEESNEESTDQEEDWE